MFITQPNETGIDIECRISVILQWWNTSYHMPENFFWRVEASDQVGQSAKCSFDAMLYVKLNEMSPGNGSIVKMTLRYMTSGEGYFYCILLLIGQWMIFLSNVVGWVHQCKNWSYFNWDNTTGINIFIGIYQDCRPPALLYKVIAHGQTCVDLVM